MKKPAPKPRNSAAYALYTQSNFRHKVMKDKTKYNKKQKHKKKFEE